MQPELQPADATAEARRIMTICNACRYCEGYCAVFPAMSRRLDFAGGDLHYLANLCHNCGECYHACQYAPPHEFDVNVPLALARVRIASYRQYAWPERFASLYARGGAAAGVALAAALAVVLLLTIAMTGDVAALLVSDGSGNFYRLLPHRAMATLFGLVAVFVAVALGIGLLRFWRDAGERLPDLMRPSALTGATNAALRLTYLHGGGAGCVSPEVIASSWRRPLHHLTFYGFLLCFAATVVGTLYHYAFGWVAPYAYTSIPVVLGTVGGVSLVFGTLGLLLLRPAREPATYDRGQAGMDGAFTALLLLTGASGLLLLALRHTAALGPLLIAHLGIVLALFVTLPYGKFVHGVYRTAALIKHALERRRPHQGLGGD